MSSHAILQPLVALLILHTIMFFWMYATRIPAINKLGLAMDPHLPPGELMNKLPANVRWKADNYNHLFEQPTMFYAVLLTLAMLGAGDATNVMLAWGYVGLRVVHSLIQVLWNKIEVRFAVYALSSLLLFALIARAAMVLWA